MSTLTSIDMNINRSSTRLHAPPGGQSSICFGTYGLDAPVVKPTQRNNINNIYGGDQVINDVAKPLRRPSTNSTNQNNIYGSDDETEAQLKKRLEARRPSNSQGMSNVMSYEENQPPAARRVRQAPGGTSSLTLG